MNDTDADAIMRFADLLLPGDDRFPAASAAGMRAMLLPRLGPHAAALLAAIAAGPIDPARLAADAPDLFDDVRKTIFLTYYEQEPVIAAIRDLGEPYNWAPLPEGYAPEPFSPVIDAPTHRRGAWLRTDEVVRVDLTGLDHLRTATP